uniref:Reverse transcriptase domain-containing protein n=1 Tax=Haemonchus contortus TaxID=6289 RepID=A0A7I4YLC8_HAECO
MLLSLPQSGEGIQPSPSASPLESAPRTKGPRTHDLSSEGHVDGSTTTIRTPYSQTGAIDVHGCGAQGSALSPFLFLFTMDIITEELMDGPLNHPLR